MIFNEDTKEELSKMAKHSGINVTYYDGYILEFDKVNVHAITPHKLEFSKREDCLTVLHYDEYHEDSDLFIVDEKGTYRTPYKYQKPYKQRDLCFVSLQKLIILCIQS